MFKKLMYDKVVAQLSSGDTKFQGGYLIGLDRLHIPYVVNADTLSAFDYEREIVIPVSEEYFTETPSVHAADRSDYVAQYQIMFQTSRETEVMTVMDVFRDYFFTNKQFTLDGYNVSIKTTRGEKQPGVPVDSGDFYVRFKINVYLTAVKNGEIWADSDKWEIRLHAINAGSFIIGKWYQILFVGNTDFISLGAPANEVGARFYASGVGVGTGTAIMTQYAITDGAVYETLKLNDDIFATNGNTTFANKDVIAKGLVANTTSNSKLLVFYNGTDMEKLIYHAIMNRLDKDTLFDMKHTHDGETYEYVVLLTSRSRRRQDNSIKIMEFNWIEADV